MPVNRIFAPRYMCVCDICKNVSLVDSYLHPNVYNQAQAVRSLGWSYSIDKKVICKHCRQQDVSDRYRYKT